MDNVNNSVYNSRNGGKSRFFIVDNFFEKNDFLTIFCIDFFCFGQFVYIGIKTWKNTVIELKKEEEKKKEY